MRPPDVVSGRGVAARKARKQGTAEGYLPPEWQDEQMRRTGWVQHESIANAIVYAFQRREYSKSHATVVGHLAAVGGRYNWQGNTRIAELVGVSRRTVQRVRARLEREGFIRSHLLLTGDQVPGQRRPVWHPHVVRDVSRLHRIAVAFGATVRVGLMARKQKPRRPSAAEPPRTTPASAEQLQALAKTARPEFAAFFHGMAEAAARRAPKPPVPDDELDAIDRELAEETRRLQDATGRGPPRGPPADAVT